ncbi:MAG: sugar diacid recognition domain-containing protein [Bacilli bacterium]
MLTPEFAQRFIQKTVKTLPFNVNIMNHRGIIIASKDVSRVGDFHEVAHGLLTGRFTSGVVTEKDNFAGTKPGINMFIDYNDRHIGVICVSGNPEEVQVFAYFIKSSIETMLDYELKMQNRVQKFSAAEKFLYYILYEDRYKSEEANRLFNEATLNKDKLHIMIIIRCSNRFDSKLVKRVLNTGNADFKKGVSIEGENGEIFFMKPIDATDFGGLENYKEQIGDYFKDIESKIPMELGENDLRYFVGSLQNNVDYLKSSFLHAQFLSVNKGVDYDKKILFFLDHIQEYLRYSVTIDVYNNIFSSISSVFQGDERLLLIETIQGLEKNNYNLAKTSKDLHIHRNTISFRLNKLKSNFGLDPLNVPSDRELLKELIYYLVSVRRTH